MSAMISDGAGMVDLRLGDCLDVMRGLPDASVDAVVTDPPYGLGFMGRAWDHGVPGVPFWEQVARVAKPGAHLLAFGGTRTFHRMACAIEDAGWEIRDTIMWVYGQGFPKSHNLDGEWQGWGTALKPAWEPIIVARKPVEGTVAGCVQKWGTGALNIDGSRVGIADWGSRPPRTPNFILGGGRGTNLTASAAPDGLGRWPANLIHDGSEEIVGLFPGEGDGSAARFFYCAKASKADRDEGLEIDKRTTDDGRNTPIDNPFLRGETLRRNHHPTVKPTSLMRYLCRLVTPPGGVVLDPFMGSGSTGRGAVLEGFRFVGIEREAEYLEIARARIAAAAQQETVEPACVLSATDDTNVETDLFRLD